MIPEEAQDQILLCVLRCGRMLLSAPCQVAWWLRDVSASLLKHHLQGGLRPFAAAADGLCIMLHKHA